MLSDAAFKIVMEEWSQWCLQGCQMGQGYPRASAFVNDYQDHNPGPVVPIDDDEKLTDVELAVAEVSKIKGVGRMVARVLRAHYQAQHEYLHLSQARRCKKLRLKPQNYYTYLNIGKEIVKAMLEDKWHG